MAWFNSSKTACRGALILGVMENGMNMVAVDAYFQQSIFGIVIIVSVALTFDRSKTATIK
jgi:ribose/xylose/arabinose/galactoside ABC-type transport system permease subunit